MVSARTVNIFAAFFALISFVFLLLVNLGTNVIQSIFIMKVEINNVTAVFGLYGSCVDSKFANFQINSFAGLFTCTKGGLISDFGTAGSKFLEAMHPIALILSFALVIIGLIAVFNSENGCLQNIFSIISIIGSIVILLAIIGDIIVFNDTNSQFQQFQQNVNVIIHPDTAGKTSFGPGFGLAIASLVFMMITICFACKSRTLTVKVKQKGCFC
ncbi:hypothetical protein C1645_849689 [Glomus cerebriforme]|uniref:Actin cortical patch SUR7/pH-response regulator pali n=1 Tax=Glomus cerebriforme TaxID=658196 RepID=A0A397T535_9GLOM|nr:hypothetical protein C1645_849689 [Glomus cerebriforme]